MPPPRPDLSPNDRVEVAAVGVKKPTAPPSRELLLASSLGPLVATVQQGAPPEGPGEPDKMWLAIMGVGGAGLPIGFVAPPIAAAMIVGGAFLILGSATMYATESSQSGAVARALQDADFPAALETALRTRALPRTTDTPPVAQATVMVIGWGVVSTSGAAAGRHCFVAVVTLSVAKGSEKRYEESLRLAPGGGSEGAPPAQCASLGRFAENQGQLARESARDYAEILAVMLLDRFAKLK